MLFRCSFAAGMTSAGHLEVVKTYLLIRAIQFSVYFMNVVINNVDDG